MPRRRRGTAPSRFPYPRSSAPSAVPEHPHLTRGSDTARLPRRLRPQFNWLLDSVAVQFRCQCSSVPCYGNGMGREQSNRMGKQPNSAFRSWPLVLRAMSGDDCAALVGSAAMSLAFVEHFHHRGDNRVHSHQNSGVESRRRMPPTNSEKATNEEGVHLIRAIRGVSSGADSAYPTASLGLLSV